jgi:1-acyl-sn-glycerol-3-phosphate acyltransferase
VNRVDAVWRVGRMTLSPLTFIFSRLRSYGRENVPREGGVVLALNHFHWLDPAAFGASCPRTIYYMAKIEAHRIPGLGQVIRSFGTFSVRRGESDREAVRLMRQAARDGRVLGLFVEGTRQTNGRPGKAQPGAAMVALQEDVPVLPAAVYGTQLWKLTHWTPCSVAFGEPLRFDGLPKSGKGYKEASLEIERRIHVLFDWLAGVHARGRPRGEVPPL